MSAEIALGVMVLCLLVLALILAVFLADYLLELRKVQFLEDVEDRLVKSAGERLFEDYQNVEEWVQSAEELRLQLEVLQEEIELVRHERKKLQARDTLGRFTKKGK